MERKSSDQMLSTVPKCSTDLFIGKMLWYDSGSEASVDWFVWDSVSRICAHECKILCVAEFLHGHTLYKLWLVGLRPCWHWSVVLSFFYFASPWFLKLVDTHCFGAWRKSQTSCLVSKVVLWCFLQYSAVSRDSQLCCLTHSTICTTVHGFAPIALLGKTFASFEMEACEYGIAARAPSFFLVDLEGQSTTAFGNKVVRTLESLSPSKGEDRLGVLRKLAKFAAMVHNVAPPVLLLWKRPSRDETADKPRALRKHFALARTCSFQTDSDNVIKFMSLHICEFSLWQGVAGGMQGGAGDRQGNAWKPSTRPLSTRTCQKKMRRTCTSRWTHQSFMILLYQNISKLEVLTFAQI